MRALVLSGVLALVVTSCAEAPGAAPVGSEGPSAGGQVVEGTTADIRTLFPPLAADLNSARAAQKIYAPLWRADPITGELLPDLARWTVSADGLTYSWEIDPRASWSDGRALAGNDFHTTLKAYARSAKAVRKSNFEDIDGFVAYRDGKASDIAGHHHRRQAFRRQARKGLVRDARERLRRGRSPPPSSCVREVPGPGRDE